MSTTLVGQFDAQASRTPDATAVAFRQTRLTYRQLADRAEHVAAALRGRAIGPRTVVGLHLVRSVDLLAAVLGVLKAGAAYLPLDPTYPAERLAFMVADSGAALVLTDRPAAAPSGHAPL